MTAVLAKYYNDNKSRYGSPGKRNVNLILTKAEEQSESAKKEIESGKSFASVAKAVSIDPVSRPVAAVWVRVRNAVALRSGQSRAVWWSRSGEAWGGVAEWVSRGWADRRVEL